MTPTPEQAAPATLLLSGEQLAFLREQLAIAYPDGVPESNYTEHITKQEIFANSQPHYVADLLAHLSAYQAQVRDTLQNLIKPLRWSEQAEEEDDACCAENVLTQAYNEELRAAAATLGLEL